MNDTNDKDNTTHSKLPWKIIDAYIIGDIKFPIHYIQSEVSPQSDICHGSSLANAKLIVTAVNNHAMLVEALTQLVNKLELIHEDRRYLSVWSNYHIHGGKYDGPTYEEELDKAKEALKNCGDE